MFAHRPRRKFIVARATFPGVGAINELDEVDRAIGRKLSAFARGGSLAKLGRKFVEQSPDCFARGEDLHRLGRDLPRPAGEADFLFARHHVHDRARAFGGGGGEQVDLEYQHFAALLLEEVSQRRVRHEPAIPIMAAVDLDWRKARRQRARGHDVARIDRLALGIEEAEIATVDIDRADRQPHRPLVDHVPVDQPIERGDQRRGVIIAQRGGAPRGRKGRRQHPRAEEARHPRQRDKPCRPFVEEFAFALIAKDREARQRARYRRPEIAQRAYAFLGRIAGDQRGIDRPDRNSGDPVDLDPAFGQRFGDARLIASQRAPALEHQRHRFGQRHGAGVARRVVGCGFGHAPRCLVQRSNPTPGARIAD